MFCVYLYMYAAIQQIFDLPQKIWRIKTQKVLETQKILEIFPSKNIENPVFLAN